MSYAVIVYVNQGECAMKSRYMLLIACPFLIAANIAMAQHTTTDPHSAMSGGSPMHKSMSDGMHKMMNMQSTGDPTAILRP